MGRKIEKTVTVAVNLSEFSTDELCDELRDRDFDPLQVESAQQLLGQLMHYPHVLEAMQDMRRGVTQGTIKLTPRIQELFKKVFDVDL